MGYRCRESITVLSTMECKDYLVVGEGRFDGFGKLSALCHGDACAAWVEEAQLNQAQLTVDISTFLETDQNIEEAFKELFKIGDQMKAISRVESMPQNQTQAMLDEFKAQNPI